MDLLEEIIVSIRNLSSLPPSEVEGRNHKNRGPNCTDFGPMLMIDAGVGYQIENFDAIKGMVECFDLVVVGRTDDAATLDHMVWYIFWLAHNGSNAGSTNVV